MDIDAQNINRIKISPLLDNIRLSAESMMILQKIPMILLVAPTASGRNTIIKSLLKKGSCHFLLSDTTRPMREGEQDGVEYNFKSYEEVIKGLKQGDYIEANLIHNQQISGINIDELKRAAQSQKIAIKDIEIGGSDTLHNLKPDTKSIFVLPPSLKEWMHRLDNRGVMSADEKHRRLQSAATEIKESITRDYLEYCVNDKLAETVEQIHNYIVNDVPFPINRAQGHQMAENLLNGLSYYLAT